MMKLITLKISEIHTCVCFKLHIINKATFNHSNIRMSASLFTHLALVDVVIGMDRRLGSHFSPHHLYGSVGDNLIHIHVGLSARACLPDDQGKMVIQLATDHLNIQPNSAANSLLLQTLELLCIIDPRSLPNANQRISWLTKLE